MLSLKKKCWVKCFLMKNGILHSKRMWFILLNLSWIFTWLNYLISLYNLWENILSFSSLFFSYHHLHEVHSNIYFKQIRIYLGQSTLILDFISEWNVPWNYNKANACSLLFLWLQGVSQNGWWFVNLEGWANWTRLEGIQCIQPSLITVC